MVQEIVNKYFPLVAEQFFVDCVNCLVSYGNNHIFIDTCLKAIQKLIFCANQLASGGVCPLSKNENGEVVITDNDKHLQLWFPLLTGLAGIVGHSHVDVRTAYVTVTLLIFLHVVLLPPS